MPRCDSSINNKNRRTIMNTKNFFKTVAMAMLMPAVLLTTSCSKGDDAVTNPEKPANTVALSFTIIILLIFIIWKNPYKNAKENL